MKNEIIKYIVDQYEPHTIILYGSYADGSNNINSDFDALVITDKEGEFHNGNIFAGIKLDIFIYNTELFKKDIDCEKYVQIYDGNIVIDKYGIGKELQQKICEFIKNVPVKSKEEKEYLVKWCEKMFLRTKRQVY